MLDDLGYPSIMVKIPLFSNHEVLDGTKGIHPMFIIKGEKYPVVYFSKYGNSVFHGRAYSLPDQDPATNVDMEQTRAFCRDKGLGWHLATNAEYAGIALQCVKRCFFPQGNNQLGGDWSQREEPGRTVFCQKDANGHLRAVRTATGSGPISWAHNGRKDGIYDLNGNVWEMADGIRLINGEIQVVANNDVVLPGNWEDWQAILPDGSLTVPGSANTLKVDSITPGDAQANFHAIPEAVPVLSTERRHRLYTKADTNVNYGFAFCRFADLAAKNGLAIPEVLILLAVFPASDNLEDDGFWVRNYGHRRIMRGGMWSRTRWAGVFAQTFAGAWSDKSPGIGFRSAFIDLPEERK